MSKLLLRPIALLVTVAFIMLPARGAFSLPEGGTIVDGGGTATIDVDGTDSNKLNIGNDANRLGERAIIEYSSFSIAQPETVEFYQASSSSVALNRVIGTDPSSILGKLIANGRIFIINPNGVLFGADSRVDTAGLAASTLSMTTSDIDFMNPSTTSFSFSGGTNAVVNAGALNAPGGFVAFLGPRVENSGTIIAANAGTIALAAGNALTVSLDAQNLISVAITTPSSTSGGAEAGVINTSTGTLQAQGGKVLLTSSVLNTIFNDAINTSGIIEGKEIRINGNGDIDIFGATITASAPSGDALVDIRGTTAVDRPDPYITIDNSAISAQVPGTGDAQVKIHAGNYEETSGLYDSVNYDEIQHLSGEGMIDINHSSIVSSLGNAREGGRSFIKLGAQDIYIDDNSRLSAECLGTGSARVDITAGAYDLYHLFNVYQNKYFTGGYLSITGASEVQAKVDGVLDPEVDDYFEQSFVSLEAGQVAIDDSSVMAIRTQEGQAGVSVTAAGTYQYHHGSDYSEDTVSGGGLGILNDSLVAAVVGWQEGNGDDQEDVFTTGTGSAWVDLVSGKATSQIDCITIEGSTIGAGVAGDLETMSNADVTIRSGNSHTYNSYYESGYNPQTEQGSYQYSNTEEFSGDALNIRGSQVLAWVGHGDDVAGGYANINLAAGPISITSLLLEGEGSSAVIPSLIQADVSRGGSANVDIRSGDYEMSNSGSHILYPLYDGYVDYRSDSDTFSDSLVNGSIDVYGSSILTGVEDGWSAIGLYSGGFLGDEVKEGSLINSGAVTIDGVSVLNAVVNDSGQAQININSGNHDYSENNSYNNYYSFSESHNSSESLNSGSIDVLGGSSILAKTGHDRASIGLYAGGLETLDGSDDLIVKGVTIEESSVEAKALDYGDASLEIFSGSRSYSDSYSSQNNSLWNYYLNESEYENSYGGAIDIFDSSLLAYTGSGEESADIYMGAKDITIEEGSSVTSQVGGSGNAKVEINAADFSASESSYSFDAPDYYSEGSGLAYQEHSYSHSDQGGVLNLLSDSSVSAIVGLPLELPVGVEPSGAGTADIFLTGSGPDSVVPSTLNINDSSVTAQVFGYGDAHIRFYDGNYSESNSQWSYDYYGLSSLYSDYTGSSENKSIYDGTVNILNGSSILASVKSGYNSAIEVSAENINIADSALTSQITDGSGYAWIDLSANRYYLNGWLYAGQDYSFDVDNYDGIYDDWQNYRDEDTSGGNLNVLNSALLASVNNSGIYKSYAELYLSANKITVDETLDPVPALATSLTAQVFGYGDTEVMLDGFNNWENYAYSYGSGDTTLYSQTYEYGYGGDVIDILNSNILAVTDEGDAEVDLSTRSGLNVVNSIITADVNGLGHAGIYAYDTNNIDYWPEEIQSIASMFLNSKNMDGPIEGDINIVNSVLHAEAANAELVGTAVIGLESEYDITIENSEVSAQDVNDIAAVALFAEGELNIEETSTVSATTQDSLAIVAGLAGYDIYAPGTISANGGDGFGLVVLGAADSIFTGTVNAKGTLDTFGLLEGLLNDYIGSSDFYLDIANQYNYGSAVLLGSLNGDIYLGDISADLVGAAALGLDCYFGDGYDYYGDYYGGNIFSNGLVSANYLALLARHDIGTCVDDEFEFAGPINTDVGILSAYSWDYGDIFINEANDLEVGLYLPLLNIYTYEGEVITEQLGALGFAVAANDGIVSIVSQGDMLINSIIAPRGGVFLQSTGGSIYAGHAIDPRVWSEDVDYLSDILSSGLGYLGMPVDSETISYGLSEALMDVRYTPWSYIVGAEYFSPIMIECGYSGDGEGRVPNVIAGGYSYFSTPVGTIGVGTPDDKNPAISGEIYGVVDPGVEAVTGVYPSAGIDLSRYTPPGLVYFYGERLVKVEEAEVLLDLEPIYEGSQIWPESITEPPISSENALVVSIFGDENIEALPEWFVNSLPVVEGDGYQYPDFSNVAALTLEIGPPVVPPAPTGDGAGIFASNLAPDLKAYYEILNVHRISGIEPATPTNFFGYHPLRTADMSAFDGITLDEGAYDFISDNIMMKKKPVPYFGIE